MWAMRPQVLAVEMLRSIPIDSEQRLDPIEEQTTAAGVKGL